MINDQALQDQQEDAKNPLPHSEDDGAERGCARSETQRRRPSRLSAESRCPARARRRAPTGYATRLPSLDTIGVGYDGSPASEQALTVASTLARERGAELSAFEGTAVGELPPGALLGSGRVGRRVHLIAGA